MPSVLVAEDDESISEVMRIILEEEGYQVRIATNRNEILSLFEASLPAILFLDVRLGGESGEDIAKEILNDPRTKNVAVILVSADSETKEIAKRVGAHDFLLKPFDMRDLVALCQKHSTL